VDQTQLKTMPVIQVVCSNDDTELMAIVGIMRLLDIMEVAVHKLADPGTALPSNVGEQYLWLREALNVFKIVKEEAGSAVRQALIDVYSSKQVQDAIQDIKGKFPCQS